MTAGFVYFIRNPLHKEGIYKIGMTENLKDRMASLYHATESPGPWTVIATVETEKYKELERHLHHVYAAQRVNPKKEYFEFNGDDVVDDVLDMLEECASLINGKFTVFEDQSTAREGDDKRRKFSMKLINIPVGAKVQFINEFLPEPVDFYVAANGLKLVTDLADIEDKSKWQTLSSTAQELLHKPGLWSSCPDCWFYNGKSFAQLREELGV